ncbi:MAG: RagB/SusD family nutrient uptake outer membrane protein [Flammeovirgaceae bacterium]|jgi:starch-binding outer membrane protein, SusD/RagB family|nr:RagB/SusD family nutrient uptake outer membrane protein [Flammeovirgaceae bacterium]|tara:strand:+ start:4411 stop:5895 length:1485 start_codon:yes stop_codon:yes gene_type:complete
MNNTMKVLLIFILLVSSCDDLLEKPLQNSLTQASFPISASDALAAINACYYVFRESGYHTGMYPIDDIMSDDARKGSNPDDAASTIGPFDTFEFAATNGSFSNWWNTLYTGIKRTNVVINLVQDIEMDQTLKAQYIAEAQFIRAQLYFDAVRAWGGVPLILTTTPTVGVVRSTLEQVYDQIELDLLDAIPNLPLKAEISLNEQGRITKGAAQGLLGKSYLYQKRYGEALAELKKVITSGQYGLEPDFDDANGINGEFGVESVFEVGAVDGLLEGIENGTNFYANVQGVRGTPNRGWGFNRPTLDLINSFETGDPRLESTVLYVGEVIDEITISGDGLTPDETRDSNNNLIEVECYNQKVWTPGTIVAPTQGHNRRVMRYADVLLLAAEAANETSDIAQALIYVNQVRLRAREGNNDVLPDITTMGQEALRGVIMNERRHELALEGHRFWDLVRTDLAGSILGPFGFASGTHELMPIPQIEIDLTQGSLIQNNGY